MMSHSLKIATLHSYHFYHIQMYVTSLFYIQVCSRFHGLLRAFFSDSLAFNVAVPLNDTFMTSYMTS